MERRYFELPISQLEQERSSLKHKLGSAQSVLAGIANPDWVTNQRNLKTPSNSRWGGGLDLQGLTPEDYYSRLAGVIIPIQKTLAATAIPDLKKELGQVSLEANRRQALDNFDAYLQSPSAKLRPHQLEALESLRAHLATGETAGTIVLPGRSGKTYLAAELASVTNLKAVFLSPSRPILKQTEGVIQNLAPDISVTNFYSADKNLRGQVLNTTYQSFVALLEAYEKGELPKELAEYFKPEEIGLLVCDEAHMALGDQRHKIYSKLPQALMIGLTATPHYEQLEGYRKRGMVQEGEKWMDLFIQQIHYMGIEEGMERGICLGADVYLVTTQATVDNIEITQGDYSKAQLERKLNTESRNWLTIAMIAGLDKLPPHIKISEEKRAEIEHIHQQIKDKDGMVIFGLSIAHIEQLAQMLKDASIDSVALAHGQIPEAVRNDLLKNNGRYERGEVKVILTVDLLSFGWDSHKAQVGFFLAPTKSGVKAAQEFYRILTPAPELDKERAIAIQLIDQFQKPNQAPVLIPNIFDPDYVLRGTSTGTQHISRSANSKNGDRPLVTFSGINIEALLEQTRTQDILRTNLTKAPLAEVYTILEGIIQKTAMDYPEVGVLGILQQVAESLPFFIPTIKQQEALQAATSIDSNTASIGKNVIIWINSKTILNALEPFLTDSQEDNDDLVQETLETLIKHLHRLHSSTYPIPQNIHNITTHAASKAVALRENMPVGWVSKQKYKQVKRSIDIALRQTPLGLDKAHIDYLTQTIHEQTGLNKAALKQYITYRNVLTTTEVEEADIETNIELDTKTLLREDLEDALDTLTGHEATVMRLRFGFLDGSYWTLEEIGKEFGVTRERPRQIEAKALRKLRHPSRSKRLAPYLEDEEVNRPIAFFPEGEERFGRIRYFQIPEITPLPPTQPAIEFSEAEQKALYYAGVRNVAGFFVAPPEEIFKEADADLISAAKKVVERLAGVYDPITYLNLRARWDKRQANADLIRFIAYAIKRPDRRETESLYWKEDSVARQYISASEKESWLNWIETSHLFRDLDYVCTIIQEAFQRLQAYLKDK